MVGVVLDVVRKYLIHVDRTNHMGLIPWRRDFA